MLQQAGIYASKYNRVTAYMQQNISTSYSIQIEYATSTINLWGIDTEKLQCERYISISDA